MRKQHERIRPTVATDASVWRLWTHTHAYAKSSPTPCEAEMVCVVVSCACISVCKSLNLSLSSQTEAFLISLKLENWSIKWVRIRWKDGEIFMPILILMKSKNSKTFIVLAHNWRLRVCTWDESAWCLSRCSTASTHFTRSKQFKYLPFFTRTIHTRTQRKREHEDQMLVTKINTNWPSSLSPSIVVYRRLSTTTISYIPNQ